MRKLYFLLPGTDRKFACGGLWAELKTFHLAKHLCHADIVTYRQKEEGKLFIDDLLQEKKLDDVIFVISWGFDVARLATKLKQYNVVYHAHSAGYGFKLPASIPIITVSRNTMGYWGQHSPHSLIYYLPNQIGNEFQNIHLERDIDVLVQARKSSQYLMQELIPALRQKCQVFVVDSYVEDLPGLFNRAKIYLYDSAEYWTQQGVSEGFGLQPLEAIACGCQVFSSINGGLSDYLDPGFNCYKIAAYSKEYDIQRILKLLNNWKVPVLPEEFLAEYRHENIIKRLEVILDDLNDFFDHKKDYPGNINNLTKIRLTQLRLQTLFNKVKKKYFKI
ncbi:glycosyltransferase [Fischerella thermalis]|jgi:glycosyltransferase involved in cell wall biosynthesis|uniref:Glycosyl transferase group 1 n=1 Tax=Fischerella thermalis JSC-11 TaxID=741277 RepID=G6FWU2_9CYAN|nr:glycosyltransferase [Fischerella thermalis]PLZ79562.1 glycosyltransferase [Fischerella thermalis WC217]PMB04076.1 glycosyltransferase [Fischerella thermalis CCMEE 5273]EHC11107.1 glycosyl transferase group 1 [Fischerella thermalis JSC-11]MBF1989729.1 glycosyltransferase [Fischerella thermalis M58_A2018_009]MBF2058991.1 glycosyltransferase [Fischerella thermalis M66_A2018_004]